MFNVYQGIVIYNFLSSSEDRMLSLSCFLILDFILVLRLLMSELKSIEKYWWFDQIVKFKLCKL